MRGPVSSLRVKAQAISALCLVFAPPSRPSARPRYSGSTIPARSARLRLAPSPTPCRSTPSAAPGSLEALFLLERLVEKSPPTRPAAARRAEPAAAEPAQGRMRCPMRRRAAILRRGRNCARLFYRPPAGADVPGFARRGRANPAKRPASVAARSLHLHDRRHRGRTLSSQVEPDRAGGEPVGTAKPGGRATRRCFAQDPVGGARRAGRAQSTSARAHPAPLGAGGTRKDRPSPYQRHERWSAPPERVVDRERTAGRSRAAARGRPAPADNRYRDGAFEVRRHRAASGCSSWRPRSRSGGDAPFVTTLATRSTPIPPAS